MAKKKEEFYVEFDRRMEKLCIAFEQYKNGKRSAGSILPYLFSCASYCWYRNPIKREK